MDDRTIAIWGFVLGSIGTIVSIVLAMNELSKKKRAIRVTHKIGKTIGIGHQAIFVKALNNGPRPVEIVDIGFSTKNKFFVGSEKAYETIVLPKKLEFGESVTAIFLFATISTEIYLHNDSIKKVIVIDGEDKKHKKSFPLSESDYIKLID